MSRIDRLDAVISRAIEESANSLGEEDLAECFGSIKSQFGTSMNRLFSNMIQKVDSNIEAEYKDICIRRDLEERLMTLSTTKSSESRIVDGAIRHSMSKTVEDLKAIELEKINHAIGQVEAEMENLSKLANRQKASLVQEVNALAEERNKLSSNSK